MSIERLTLPSQDAATGRTLGTEGMTINGVTYGLIYLSAIPLLTALWLLGRATVGIQGMIFLGAIGFLVLMPWIDALYGSATFLLKRQIVWLIAGILLGGNSNSYDQIVVRGL
jgi:hypothetical protein